MRIKKFLLKLGPPKSARLQPHFLGLKEATLFPRDINRLAP
jgi:hypothetical protein